MFWVGLSAVSPISRSNICISQLGISCHGSYSCLNSKNPAQRSFLFDILHETNSHRSHQSTNTHDIQGKQGINVLLERIQMG